MTLRAALLSLTLALPAAAQSWPQETGIAGDGLRGSIAALGRLQAAPAPRPFGEERREAVAGALDGVRGWLRDRADQIGQDDREARRFWDQQRGREAEWGQRPWR